MFAYRIAQNLFKLSECSKLCVHFTLLTFLFTIIIIIIIIIITIITIIIIIYNHNLIVL